MTVLISRLTVIIVPPTSPRGLEIRSFEQKIQVQSIKPEMAIKFVASSKNTLVASNSMVFKLEPSPYDRQVQACIQDKQFELALSIAVSGCGCRWSSVHSSEWVWL